MQPMKCPACGGSDFEHDQFGTGLAAFPRTFTNIYFGAVLAKGSVCLLCGSVALHVDEATLEKLRARNPAWKEREAAV